MSDQGDAIDNRIGASSGLAALPRLASGGLPDAIYVALRTAITTGALSPGQRLPQLELARQFGTSQAPVREALSRLANEGLVLLQPNRGASVVLLATEEIEEVYSLRSELESWAVRRFARCGTPADLAVLRAAIEHMQRAAAGDDQAAFIEGDRSFHRALCEASGSQLLLQLWRLVDDRVRGMMSVANTLYERGLDHVAAMHAPILDALEQGDTRRAEALIREHMHQVWDQIASKLGDVPAATPTPSSAD